jgi:Ca2+-binding EF-hand superfamily protein
MSDFKPWKVSKETLKAAKTQFKQLDADKNGTLDKKELEAFCAAIGMNAEETAARVQKLDISGDGGVSFQEFLQRFVEEQQ